MNTYYTVIFFAFILLFSNSPLAYQIYKYPYEPYQENVPVPKMIMVVPTEVDFTEPEYILSPLYQVLDRKLFILVCFIQLSVLIHFMQLILFLHKYIIYSFNFRTSASWLG